MMLKSNRSVVLNEQLSALDGSGVGVTLMTIAPMVIQYVRMILVIRPNPAP